MTNISANLFGHVFFLKEKSRYGVFSNLLYIGDTPYYQAYPISFAVYMASENDLILTDSELFKKSAIMIEYWNPILLAESAISEENITFLGKLEKDSYDILREYLTKKLIGLPSNYKFFTGPPLTANQDIRLLFRRTELEAFLDEKKAFLQSTGYMDKPKKQSIKK